MNVDMRSSIVWALPPCVCLSFGVMSGCGEEAGNSDDAGDGGTGEATVRNDRGQGEGDGTTGGFGAQPQEASAPGRPDHTDGGPDAGARDATTRTLVPLTPVDAGNPSVFPFGIVGGWYAYGDGYGTNGLPPGQCEMGGYMPSQCSTITFPPPPLPLATDAGLGAYPQGGPDGGNPGAICLSGTAAQVTPYPQGGAIYGIGLGFDLNNTAGTPSAYNAASHAIVGFSFTVSGVPTGPGAQVLVEFPTSETTKEPPSTIVTADGPVTVLFSDFPRNVTCVCGCPVNPALDGSQLLSVRFHVTTDTIAAFPVDPMCVSGFAAIVDE